MRLTRATSEAIRYACLHYHYSKAVPVNPIGYNVYNGNDEWCGVILYGMGATANIGSPYNLPQGGVLELTRVALNGKQEQTSMAVAMSLKQLKKDCPQCRLVISYADCDQKHLGTIYQATNWIFEGTMKGDTYFIINGCKKHRKSVYSKIHSSSIEEARKKLDKNAEVFYSAGKRKYLMPMDKKMRKQVEQLAQPYPKNEDWVKIDRKTFKQ